MLNEEGNKFSGNAGEPLYKLNSVTGGLGYSAAVIALILSSVLFAVIFVILSACGVPDGSPVMLYLNFFASPVAIAAAVAVILKYFKIPFKEIFPVKCKPKYYLIAVLIIFGMLFSMSWINDVFVQFFKLFGYEESNTMQALEIYISTMSGWELIPALIIIALIPATMEELLFRGLILKNCEASAGTIASVLLSGFAFSLFHGSPEQTVYQFVLGCLFAFVAVKSGSILPAILMHFINNALVVILLFSHAYDADGSLAIPPAADITITIIAVLALIGGIAWLVFDKVKISNGEKDSVKKFFMYASVGIAVMALIWITSLFGVG